MDSSSEVLNSMLGGGYIHSIAYACHQLQYNLTIGAIPPAGTNDIFYVGLLKLCKGLLFNEWHV
jgi:hypothetical protein